MLGVPCRHIGFSTDRIDWQLWVADGAQPLPQKLVITYKTEEQSPQYTVIFSKWSLTGRASDLAFEFIPPREQRAGALARRGERRRKRGRREGGKESGKEPAKGNGKGSGGENAKDKPEADHESRQTDH